MEYSLCDETFEDINSEFDYELMGERDIAEKLYHEIRDMSFNDKSIIGRKYFNLFQRERKLEQRRLENKTGLYSTIVEKTKIISKILQAKDELAELREAQEYEKLVLKTRKK
jgi:ABC-type phosphate transport system auxiliary subunit